MDVLILVIGLVLLIKGADVLIDSVTALGRRLRVPAFVLGLIAVSIGTSAPELVIGIFSAVGGNVQIALGNVIGSNTVNILIVLAIMAMVKPLPLTGRVIRRQITLTVLIEAGLVVLLWSGDNLGRLESAVLLAGAIAFTGYTVSSTRQAARREAPDTPFEADLFEYLQDEAVLAEAEAAQALRGGRGERSVLSLVILFVISLAAVIGGAQLALNGAVGIARSFDLDETFIGLTVVAFGTSLPELVTGLTAIRRDEPEIAIGNIFGSAIYNILLILGVSGLINPIMTMPGVLLDALFMLLAGILVWLPSIFRGRLSLRYGIGFLIIYAGYLGYKLAMLL